MKDQLLKVWTGFVEEHYVVGFKTSWIHLKDGSLDLIHPKDSSLDLIHPKDSSLDLINPLLVLKLNLRVQVVMRSLSLPSFQVQIKL